MDLPSCLFSRQKGVSSAYNLKHPATRLLASHHRAVIHQINHAEQVKMSRDTSASNPEKQRPPYSVIAPRLDRPGRHGVLSDSCPSRRDRTLLPPFEQPPPYSRESKGSKRLLPRYQKLSPHAPYSHRFILRLPADPANSRIVIIGSWHPADIICSLHTADIYTRPSSKATGLTAASIVMLTALIILLLYLTSRIGARTAVICQVCLAVALVLIIDTWCYQANNVGERGKE